MAHPITPVDTFSLPVTVPDGLDSGTGRTEDVEAIAQALANQTHYLKNRLESLAGDAALKSQPNTFTQPQAISAGGIALNVTGEIVAGSHIGTLAGSIEAHEGHLISKYEVNAGRDVNVGRNLIAPNGTVSGKNVSATSGNVTASGNVTTTNGTVSGKNVSASAGNVTATDQVSAGNTFLYGSAKARVVTIGVASGFGNGGFINEGEYVVLTPGQGMVYPIHCPDGATMGNAWVKLYSTGTPTYIVKTKRKHGSSVLGGLASYQNLETKTAAIPASTAYNVVANFIIPGGAQIVCKADSEDYSMWITNSVSSGVDLYINSVQFTYTETVLTSSSSR